jgi:hypothetical protein
MGRLDESRIAVGEKADETRGDAADVSGHAERVRSVVDTHCHLSRVVWDLNRRDRQSSDPERLAYVVAADVDRRPWARFGIWSGNAAVRRDVDPLAVALPRPHAVPSARTPCAGTSLSALAPHGRRDPRMKVERRSEGPREFVRMTEVISVMVGGDDAVKLSCPQLDTKLRKTASCDLRPNTGLDEDARAARLHEEGVTARPTSEHEDPHLFLIARRALDGKR